MRASGSCDALEPADGRAELRADARVGAGGAAAELAGGHRHGRQRDGAARGEALDQHPPAACPPAPSPPMTQSSGMKTSLPVVGPFMKPQIERDVATADVHALVRGGDERERDAQLLLAAQELVGIEELEREAEEGGHRAQRDVALLPGEADAQHLARPRACPCRRCRSRGWRRRRSRPRDSSARSTGSRGPWRGGAGSGSSARRCRSGSAAPPARASWAPSP